MTFGLENSFRKNIEVKGRSSRVLLVVALIEALLIAYLLLYGYSSGLVTQKTSQNITPGDGYQAVFLQNGQVYFGKLIIDDSWMVLNDIYYLQASQPLQAGREQVFSQSNFQLIKLGTELHAPEDVMYLRAENVSFWENLTSSSRILEAIEKYKESR